jgi:hypothetical protein
MRATEIADRIVRDLDAGGTKRRVTEAKTRAGIRTMNQGEAALRDLLRDVVPDELRGATSGAVSNDAAPRSVLTEGPPPSA